VDVRKGRTTQGNVNKGVALGKKILNNSKRLKNLEGKDYH
jgi:hypothetical protein